MKKEEILSTESIKLETDQISKKETGVVSNKNESSEEEYLSDFKHKFRTTLSKPMIDRGASSAWAILKQCVDKELYRFSLPIIWNEPLSLLQRACENARYSDELLNQASKMKDPCERMKMVAAFLVSSTSIHVHRLAKPFNPLLGETYEYTSTDSNFRMVCEQVSHHPPITAYYSESFRPSKVDKIRWKYYGSVNPFMKINFMHACVECYPEGIQTVELPEHDEVYTWQNLKVTAHNIILGKLWFEQTGRIELINHKLNMKCVMDFKPYSWFSKSLNRMEGYIVDKKNTKIALLNGKWDEFLYATNKVSKSTEFFKRTESLMDNHNKFKKSNSNSSLKDEDITLLWKGADSQAEENLYKEFYNFSDFTLCLNELYPEIQKPVKLLVKEEGMSKSIMMGPIAPTDSRYRTDLRYFDDGMLSEATTEKNRLEEKQREKRHSDPKFQENWKPLWFDKMSHHVVNEEETFIFNQNYWKRDFSKCPDIY